MFCMHCGTYIPEETNFCTNCGAPVENRPNYQQEAPQMQSFGNSLAPTSMICGICSIVCFISMSFALGILIGAITGVILGILGILFGLLTNFNKSTTKFAITGIICASIGTIASIAGIIYFAKDITSNFPW